MTVVAIHQPNFFPWLGYFDKIRRADVFVFLDSVQQQKTGGTWSNRVRLLVAGHPRWVTAPTERSFSGVRSVGQIKFDESQEWREKVLRTLEANYRRASAYEEATRLLDPLISSRESRVAEYNIQAVVAITAALGITKKKFVRSSSLAAAGSSTDLLISITRTVGGNTYLCGGGAQDYQDDEAFRTAGIQILYQDFRHSIYRQVAGRSFVTGLSIIDALMNCGVRGTNALLCS